MPIKTPEEFRRDWKMLRDNWRARGLVWAVNKFINIIDDYPDWVKEKLHGMHLPFGYELNISCLMVNRETTWDIIRKQGDYPNNDPEDLKGE